MVRPIVSNHANTVRVYDVTVTTLIPNLYVTFNGNLTHVLPGDHGLYRHFHSIEEDDIAGKYILKVHSAKSCQKGFFLILFFL